MASRKRRHFPECFKLQAVEHVRTGGLPFCRAAEELGVHETVPCRWMARFAEPGTGPARRPVTQAQGPADLAAENARLKRAQMERDILRKAALVFGTVSR